MRLSATRTSVSSVGAGSSADADALAYIAAVEAADGQALEDGVKDAYTGFIVGAKSDGIWSAIKASCVLVGARTLPGALVPLVGSAPTNYNFVSGDYDRETGLMGNGSTKRLDSSRDNASEPQDDRHLAVYRTVAESRGATGALIGFGGSTAGDSMLLYTSSQRFYRLAFTSGGDQSDSTFTTGLVGGSRSNGTEVVGRYAGSSATYASVSATPTSGNIVVFSRGSAASPGSATDARIAFYSIGESIDLAKLDARVTNLVSAIGAAIS